jgi:DNA-binding response OmpR family regulator
MSTQIIAIDHTDSPASDMLLRELAQDGFTVKPARSLAEAAHTAPTGAVVVAWLTEPGTTTVVANLRRTSRVPLVTVIPEGEVSFLTTIDLYEAGAEDCLIGPVTAARLASSINMLVSQRSRSADLPRHSRPLLPIEERILTHLTGNGGHPVTLAQLTDQVWGPQRADQHAILRVFLHLVGRKLAEPDRLVTHPHIRLRQA